MFGQGLSSASVAKKKMHYSQFYQCVLVFVRYAVYALFSLACRWWRLNAFVKEADTVRVFVG